jgi:hypothetical protein
VEKLGRPGVYMVTDQFLSDARSASKDNGMPALRIATVPSDPYYRVRVSLDGLRPVAAAVIDAIADALIGPLTAEEIAPKPTVEEIITKRIGVTAESYSSVVEAFNKLFLDNRWGDGLPLVPPTEEAVKWMLKGTTRAPDEVIGRVAPKNGAATIEKIAVNAVMAGAKPEYLPIIIAAMEGFTDKDYTLTHVQCSTGSFTPIIWINGPIARELNVNSGMGFLGHGWRANSTIGRALRLCLLNVGQTWPQVNDMSAVGRQAAYSFFTFAENEDQSPWDPYHVDLGYGPEESTVTVSTGNTSFSTVVGGAVSPWTPEEALQQLAAAIRARMIGRLMNQKYVVIIAPELAYELGRQNFTKDGLREWFYRNSFVPYSSWKPEALKELREGMQSGWIPPHVISEDQTKEGGMIPVVRGPEGIHIIVAGGIPGYSGLWSYGAPAHQTRKVHGATFTEAGR